MPPAPTTVPLDGRECDDGPQRIEVVDGYVVVHLRALTEPFRVPVAEVACVAPTVGEPSAPYAREPVVPLAQLQGGRVAPDLVVLFARPQRVPPVRVQSGGSLHLSRKQSMSPEGLFIDGMRFTTATTDPVGRLAAAGLPSAPTAAPALARAVGVDTSGPSLEDRRRRNRTRDRALSAAALIGFAMLAVGDNIDPDRHPLVDVLLIGGFVLFVPALLAIMWLLVRRPWRGVRQP